MTDPYVYPGTAVLKNKLGEREQAALDRAERRITTAKLLQGPPRLSLSEKGFKALHRRLFEELYDWAGEYRTVNSSKGGAPFCAARFIEDQMKRRFAAIRADRGLVSKAPHEFARAAAEHINELNAIHPFRDGNGRTMRLLLCQLADRAGHKFEIARLDKRRWMAAVIAGFREQDNDPLAKVIGDAVRERGRG